MLLSIIILAILAGITYFHYLQGAFSSAISALSAVVAALVAFGYYETIVVNLPPGKMVDASAGMVLIGLYGVTYIVLRSLLDYLVPGNLRISLWVDRGFAIFFGLVAGIMATGVFATGAQLLPFGPSVGMHARYELRDRNVTISRELLGQNARSNVDGEIRDELVDATLEPGKQSSLLIPTDELVNSLVAAASEGAFSGDISFRANHPDLLTEAFANRLGVDTGRKRVIINTADEQAVALPAKQGLSLLPTWPAASDIEVKLLRPGETSLTFPKDNTKQLLVVRLIFQDAASDPDGYVRLTPAGCPLVFGGQTFYPVGTMTPNGEIGLARIDDQLIVSMKDNFNSADLVYAIDSTLFEKLATAGKFKPDSAFVQVKLLGRIPLSGKQAEPAWAASEKCKVLRKKAIAPPPSAAPSATPK